MNLVVFEAFHVKAGCLNVQNKKYQGDGRDKKIKCKHRETDRAI